jgi:hypothetical protein
MFDDRRFTIPLPSISAAQVEWIVKQVVAYIERQRQTYIRRAVPLSRSQNATMLPFFSKSSLNSAQVAVLGRERVGNPPFYGELLRMGFEAGSLPNFATMTAITFVDTVVSHAPFTNRVLFHELIHVVQYEKLGLMGFAAKYVTGFLSGGSYEPSLSKRMPLNWKHDLRLSQRRLFQQRRKFRRGCTGAGSRFDTSAESDSASFRSH